MLFTSTVSGLRQLRLPKTRMWSVSCPWPKPRSISLPHCRYLFCIPLQLRRTV